MTNVDWGHRQGLEGAQRRMKLHLEWSRQIPLRRSRQRSLVYTIDMDKLPDEPGLYVFGRRFGNSFEALYVGKAKTIRRRVRNQLNNSRLRTELQAHNDLLRETSIELVDAPAESHLPIDYSDRFVRRIFNDARWDHGGRFYGGWWQRIPSSCRAYIEINGEMTTERDYSGLHIMLLYARQRIRYWQEIKKDPYTLEGYEKSPRMRDFLKELLLTTLNAESVKKAKQAIQHQINFEEPNFAWVKESKINLDEIIDAFMQKHDPIRQEFFTGYGLNLQYYDSLMAEYVINELTSRGLPVLCVHDSFVVKKYDLVTLNSLMESAYYSVIERFHDFGGLSRAPKITSKGLFADLIEGFIEHRKSLIAESAHPEEIEALEDNALSFDFNDYP